jgi:hypothetical protein
MTTGQIFSQMDLAKRWGVTKQVVKNWEFRHTDFPKPLATINEGRTKIYDITEVERYENIRNLKGKAGEKNSI